MTDISNLNDGNIFPVHKKHHPASLTQEEIASIIRFAETYGMSEDEEVKLLLFFRDRKKSAYFKNKQRNLTQPTYEPQSEKFQKRENSVHPEIRSG